jgi:hypothetical protein
METSRFWQPNRGGGESVWKFFSISSDFWESQSRPPTESTTWVENGKSLRRKEKESTALSFRRIGV